MTSIQVKQTAPMTPASVAGSTSAPAPRSSERTAAGPTIPEWVKDAVFYQVFPDRFANGDVGNDPTGTIPWGAQPTNDAFMGGDLNGLTQKIGYLSRLGVNALYMNPVFESPSNHGYDTTDYNNVSERLGGNHAFRQFTDAAHRNGIKVMLDGVFNHTSHQHPWFRDVREKGPKSQYFDRFDVTQWPIKYERDAQGVLRSKDYRSWWGYASLPELKNDNPAVRDAFLTGPDAVMKKWLRDFKVDGWRMDVADEVEPEFWREARKAIKSTNPDAYVVAENWHDASSMVQGDQFDGAMNYKFFQQPAVEFFGRKSISADDFVSRLKNTYPGDAKFGMLNILDSHDTPRFINEAGGDWFRQRPAAIFQMTYVGAPVVYYGDELGLDGGKDPDSRRAFPWDNVPGNPQREPGARLQPTGESTGVVAPATGAGIDAVVAGATQLSPVPAKEVSNQLFNLYRTLIATRTAEPTLRRGEFSVLATHNGDRTVAYRRNIPGVDRDAIVALNSDVTSHAISIPVNGVAADGTTYVDALSGAKHIVEGGKLQLPTVDGNFGAVLLRDVPKA